MEKRLARGFFAIIALLATCGCLSFLVAFGGIGMYFIGTNILRKRNVENG